ncbi:ImmA/IrrE family metallo-endopeptidase [Brevibacillus fulvus]|uniref:Zn-dependent peptidase ImmA (M78 family) n=1 Tax=Brevibacillus fulvus TaxID=1125967 RepID=A0A939BVQ0_9BACL|nr:ImmA/IrrE family metallo-endopeptidase [Brevibacillus fulvus]MBM7590926.1 Zn-dependent peptidase ImmA (M78 family) [Brevibacillus fulvus]
MLNFYEPTVLEEWVEKFYIKHNIRTPSNLSIENMSAILGIGVTFAPGVDDEVLFDEEYTHVFINSLHSRQRQWEVFCHEICHPLRHLGNQIMLPDEFRKMQEIEANAFQYYAAIPFFMVRDMKLPDHQNEIIDLLAREFGVTHEFAKKRWDQILRRIARGRSHHEFITALANQYKRADPANWSHETKKLFSLAIQRKLQKGQGVVIR